MPTPKYNMHEVLAQSPRSKEAPNDVAPTPILDRLLTTVDGITEHRARLIHEHLGGISTIRDLKAYIDAGGSLQKNVKGVGEKTEATIIEGLKVELERIPGKIPLRKLPKNYILDGTLDEIAEDIDTES